MTEDQLLLVESVANTLRGIILMPQPDKLAIREQIDRLERLVEQETA